MLFTFRNIRGAAERDVQPDAARNAGTVIRVGGNVKPPVKVRDARPNYPSAALAANVEGAVVLDLHIGVDGSVLDASVLRSIPLLDDAAIEAVRQWRYAPTLLNGAPVEVMVTVTINFSP